MLKAYFGALCRWLARCLHSAACRINPPPPPPPPPPPLVKTEKELAHERWVADDGDRTLRLNYSLGKQDLVLDLGGYQGQWSSDIFARYLCSIDVFEPVPQFADEISRRFASNPSIKVNRLAAGAADGHLDISISGDASSTHTAGGTLLRIPVVCFSDWFKAVNKPEIALMKINIEGGEYELLEHLIVSDLIVKIRDIQVQFHDFVSDAESRMAFIQNKLSKTHHITYQYKFIWENWTRTGVAW